MIKYTSKELEEKISKEVENIEDLISEKIERYGGALTREGALNLIAKERGII